MCWPRISFMSLPNRIMSFYDWEPRRIDTRLQANVEELGTIAEALFAVVERSAE